MIQKDFFNFICINLNFKQCLVKNFNLINIIIIFKLSNNKNNKVNKNKNAV
jgi:hypothetical protein